MRSERRKLEVAPIVWECVTSLEAHTPSSSGREIACHTHHLHPNDKESLKLEWYSTALHDTPAAMKALMKITGAVVTIHFTM